jgi:predicted dehydrogenase
VVLHPQVEYKAGEPIIGFVGAGNYASRVLIPAFKNAGAQLHSISTSGGINGVIHGNQAGFKEATTDTDALIESDEINTVAIVTRHNSHAHFVKQSLLAGKNVFVEKPLAITYEELNSVEAAYEEASQSSNPPKLMVGFNRRFAPQIQKIKSLIDPIKGPKSFIMTMNAGSIPADHWTQDINVGGGRIIGEACHFVDLMRYLVGSEIVSVQARRMGDSDAVDITEDKAAIILGFADGSFGTIHYYANGAASFPKERIEVFADGKVLQLDNFVKLKGFGFKGFKKMNLWKQDKGQNLCSQLFLDSIREGKSAPIDIKEIFEVAKVSIDIAEQLRQQ